MVTLATLYNDFKTLIKQNFYDKDEVDDALSDKQDTLVSGTSIKTINNNSLLGSGNITISGSGTVDSSLSTTSTNPVQNQAITNEINSLNLSITNILQYHQVATFQSNKIKVFANSFSGCILINGTFTVTANNVTKLCTIPHQYKPPNAITLPCNDYQTVHNYISIWNSSGDMNLRNRGSGTSVSAYNIVYYPLQSRLG